MSYQVITPNKELENFVRSSISVAEALKRARESKYKRLTKCSGLWNNYVADTDYDGLVSLVKWAAHVDVYESKDGSALYLHGCSFNDMD